MTIQARMDSKSVAGASAVKRVAVIGSSNGAILRDFGPLAREISAKRHRLLFLTPDTPDTLHNDLATELADLGVEIESYHREPGRLEMVHDVRTMYAIASALKIWRPHVTLTLGAAPLVLGAPAARGARTGRTVAMLNGIGPLLREFPERMMGESSADPDLRGVPASRRMVLHRWFALRALEGLILHNNEDRNRLEALGLLPHKLPVHIVTGHGADLENCPERPLPPLDDGLVFLMIAPPDRASGILEFCEAAKRIKSLAPAVRFVLILQGAPSNETMSVAAGELESFLEWVDIKDTGKAAGAGVDEAIRDHIRAAHVIVHPSHFGEGRPKSLLEALSIGRPIITSDTAGCRDVIDERVNGCLGQPGDVDQLTRNISSFLRRPDLIASMARASRQKAERAFDGRGVNRQILDILQIG